MSRRMLGAVLVAAIACKSGMPSGGGTAATRDSAGIRIVDNQGPAWKAGEGWKVGDSPSVDIGGRVGEAAYEVDQVRGPVALSDGRIAIGNGGTNEVRWYAATGQHLASAGRRGGGPGEYGSILGIWVGPGDSLLVYDVMVRRLTVLDRDAKFGRTFAFAGQGGQLLPSSGRVSLAVPLGWLEDGSVIALSQEFTLNQPQAGVYRDTVSAIRYGPDGAMRDTLGRFPAAETEQLPLTIGTRTISMPSSVPLGKITATAVGRQRFFAARNNAWEIEIRGLDGKLLVLARAKVVPAKISNSDMMAHRKEQLAAIQARAELRNIPEVMRKQITERLEKSKYPERFSFFSAMLADGAGNVWAEQASSPAQRSKRFDVVDSTGRWLGVVTLPADFRPTFIGTELIYGVWMDADRVEHVRAYKLRK